MFGRTKGGKVLRDQLGMGTSAALLDWLRACLRTFYGLLPASSVEP
jgi:hypothetical protein